MQKIQLLLALTGALFVCGCDKQTVASTQKIDVLTQKIFILQQNQARQLAALQAQLAALPAQISKLQNDYYTRSEEKALFYHTNSLYLLLAVDKRVQTQFQQAAAAQQAANLQAYAYHTNETDTAFFCAGQLADALAAQGKKIVADVNAETQQTTKSLGADLANQIGGTLASTVAAQGKKIVEDVNAETRRSSQSLVGEVASQIGGTLAAQAKKTIEDVNAETRRVGASLGVDLANQIKSAAPDKAAGATLQQIQAQLAQIQRDLAALKARAAAPAPAATP